LKSVDVVLINDNTGYIKINRFAETTFEEFKIGSDQIKKRGRESTRY
jgi:carboxyl-terminal processing protease